MPKGRADLRGLMVYLAMISFVVMLASGLVMFIVPSGRIGREIQWALLGLDRTAWQTLHLSFAIVFIVSGFLHLGYNWRGLLHHLRDRVSKHLTLKREAVFALILAVWMIISAIMGWPPASTLHELSAHFRSTFWAGL